MSASSGLYKKPWKTVKQYNTMQDVAADMCLCLPLKDVSGFELVLVCIVNKARMLQKHLWKINGLRT